MQTLSFTKMHGLGNDFIVINAYSTPISLSTAQLQHLADRHYGIGCDQILFIESSTIPDIDFRYRIFNSDGSEVQQCGNGARCFARYVRDKGLTDKTDIHVETARGRIILKLEPSGEVTVDMGEPQFEPAALPFIAPACAPTYTLSLGDQELDIAAVSMGNPHAVHVVPDIDAAPVAELGPAIEQHARFPERVNAGFLQVEHEHAIRLRVYERGAGETNACGSGACAAAVAGIQLGLVTSPVAVRMRGGQLSIQWAGPGAHVLMTGPAVTVFEGQIQLAACM